MQRGTWLYSWILLLVTLGVCGLVGEVVARLTMPAPLLWRQPQVRYTASPTLGFRMQPNQTCFTADKPCRTNRLGLRGPDWPWQKVSGVKRVLVLGDSIAFGTGVVEADAFPQKLEAALRQSRGESGWEVINAAVSAYNTTTEVDYLHEEGFKFDPDYVVLSFYWNDLHDKSNVGVDEAGRLRDRDDSEPDSPWKAWLNSPQMYELRNVVKQSRFLYMLADRIRYLRLWWRSESPFRSTQMAILSGTHHDRVAAGWREVEQQLIRLKQSCHDRGVDLWIAVLPMAEQLARPYPNIQYQSVMQALCTKHDLQCLDLLPKFESLYQGHTSLFISYDGDHPNEHGHDVIAQELARVIGAP